MEQAQLHITQLTCFRAAQAELPNGADGGKTGCSTKEKVSLAEGLAERTRRTPQCNAAGDCQSRRYMLDTDRFMKPTCTCSGSMLWASALFSLCTAVSSSFVLRSLPGRAMHMSCLTATAAVAVVTANRGERRSEVDTCVSLEAAGSCSTLTKQHRRASAHQSTVCQNFPLYSCTYLPAAVLQASLPPSERYSVEKQIGKGSYGVAWTCKDKVKGRRLTAGLYAVHRVGCSAIRAKHRKRGQAGLKGSHLPLPQARGSKRVCC